MSIWTHFWDMHSGGGLKEPPYAHIFIQAPQAEAAIIFYKRFGHNPYRVSCTCCGEDYSISEDPSLEQLTGFHRGCAYVCTRPDGTECAQEEAWIAGRGRVEGYASAYMERPKADTFLTPDQYRRRPDVLIVEAGDILDSERTGNVPEQGYVWKD